MPWPEKQRRAIFLNIKRKKGEAAARAFMRAHGYGKKRAGETTRQRAIRSMNE